MSQFCNKSLVAPFKVVLGRPFWVNDTVSTFSQKLTDVFAGSTPRDNIAYEWDNKQEHTGTLLVVS